jgi:NADH-quinone oxidoreductase subunit H
MVIQTISHAFFLSLILIVPIIVSVAFFTLAERKIMAAIQRRRGPNVVGV